jgi:hypothetical protein
MKFSLKVWLFWLNPGQPDFGGFTSTALHQSDIHRIFSQAEFNPEFSHGWP